MHIFGKGVRATSGTDHIKYAGMFLETSEFNDVNINNLAGYEERTRILYMIR